MNYSLEKYIRLQSKLNHLKKDPYSLQYLSKDAEAMENYLKEVEKYETEVLNEDLLPSHKQNLLSQLEKYKENLMKRKPLSFMEQHSLGILSFFLLFSVGVVLVLAADAYSKNSAEAKERGLKEGFCKKLDEILRNGENSARNLQ